MLRDLLRLLEREDARTVPELAQALGVSEALAAQMVADLIRRGYLRVREVAGCGGCPAANACAHASCARTSCGTGLRLIERVAGERENNNLPQIPVKSARNEEPYLYTVP